MTTHSGSPALRWHDGDTMLSFAVFAAIVLALLAWRVCDPANWIEIPGMLAVSPCFG